MKKIATLLLLVVGILGFHVYKVLHPIDGVEVFAFALSTQNSLDRYKYHVNLNELINGNDGEALSYLINADCGGGAGCYDHGKTLMQVLIKVGDAKFNAIACTLNGKDKAHLNFLLSAGYEYGGFVNKPDFGVLYETYPLTFKTIG